jgi:hypothetical protein
MRPIMTLAIGTPGPVEWIILANVVLVIAVVFVVVRLVKRK